MKIPPRMLPPEVVREVKDQINLQLAADRRKLMLVRNSFHYFSMVDRIATIVKIGVADRKRINQELFSGAIVQGPCYRDCHHCCSMDLEYEVEPFDVLLSYWLNQRTVGSAYRAGKFANDNMWCGLLEGGLCAIHHYKPYVCLLTSPSPRGAEKGGCRFKGEKNAKTSVHKQTMVVTGRMRELFKEWLPELPGYVGRNMNQAFIWALQKMAVTG